MTFPVKLYFYFARQFLLWLFIGLGVCVGLIFLTDLIEILRKSANKDVPFSIIISIALFRLPNLTLQVMPFAFLFGSILCFTKLNRTREIVIARGAGVSIWQFLSPAVSVSLLMGIFIITSINPISAIMNYRSEQLENKYLAGETNTISVSNSGLWLKQKEGSTETIITAASISPDNRNFKDVTVFEFDGKHKFIRRIDAKDGELAASVWNFKDVIINTSDQKTEKLPSYQIPTQLSLAKIQDSFGDPDTISFWQLPSFIKFLEDSGFNALRHKLYFHSILSTPIMLTAMVLIAAVFSLRFSRRGRTGILISSGVFSGFVFYFVSKVTASFSLSGDMPIWLAAWAPAGIFIIIGIWLLLYLEEG